MGEREDDLLDIKEAARFLNVSETSLRRWTNAGILPSLRIGGRHERRFRRVDLLAFAEAQSARTGSASARASHAHGHEDSLIGGVPVANGTHLCALYVSDDERTTIAAAFLADGFRPGHAAFLAATPPGQHAIVEALRPSRPGIDDDVSQERLVLMEYAKTTGEQLERWEALFVRAMKLGATSLRVVGDGSGVNPAPTPELNAMMLEYEDSYTEFVARRFPVVTLCLYDARLYSGVDVVELFRVHSDTFRHPAKRLLA